MPITPRIRVYLIGAEHRQETFQTPTFAFGDASGVNTQLTTILMMLDTTSDDQRVLHYLQPGFQATEDKTAISSHAQPVQVYKGPGTLGDTGLRNYSFLMFQQFNDPFSPVYVPSLGSTFDVEGFLAKNKLQPALAGIGMQVQNAGSSKGSQSSQQPLPASSPLPAVATSSPAQQSQSSLGSAPAVTSMTAAAGVSAIQSFASQASQVVGSASAAAASATMPDSAVIMSLTSSAVIVVTSQSTSTTLAVANSSTGATVTSSLLPAQSSSNAVALRGGTSAYISLFIFAWAFLA